MRLWNYLRETMLKHPSQTVCEDNAEMTYEELVAFSEMFAKKLKGEKCCVILCAHEMAVAMAVLSCVAAGVTAVPLSVRYGEAHCKKILRMINPTSIITDAEGELKIIFFNGAEYVEPEQHPAFIMCTSGTSGKPKGVMLSEQNFLTNIHDIDLYLGMDDSDYILISRPLYHCAVLTGEFLTSLVKGVKIRFYSDKFNPKILLDLIAEHNITVFCGTPTLLGMMARFKRDRTGCSLKTICISGECLSQDTAKYIAELFDNAEIYHVYGLTEACPRVCYLPPYLFNKCAPSVGIPLESVSLKIVTFNGTIAAPGEEGVLWVSGKNVMIGYYNEIVQTKKVIDEGWLCTGDIAVTDDNGLLYIKGRSDDMIIRAGMNIYPQEIECTLKADYRVRDVYVYKVEDPYVGNKIAMKISGEFSDVDEVKQLCNKMLPFFQVPAYIELCNELPRNGSGKIIRS